MPQDALQDLHPDFNLDWCKELLSSPSLTLIEGVFRNSEASDGKVRNTMFNHTLHQPRSIAAYLAFRRPSLEKTAVLGSEEGMILSLGDGLDGKAGRAHGGFNSLILDQVSGYCAHHTELNEIPPATATITIDFKAPVETPCVVLCRAWIMKIDGRKFWVDGVLEDGRGKIFATSRSLFISARPKSNAEAKL